MNEVFLIFFCTEYMDFEHHYWQSVTDVADSFSLAKEMVIEKITELTGQCDIKPENIELDNPVDFEYNDYPFLDDLKHYFIIEKRAVMKQIGE